MAKKRLVILGSLLAFAWLILGARVFQIQVLQSSHYRDLAVSQSVRREVLLPRRGEIFDRHGSRLVVNVEEKAGGMDGYRGSRICPNGVLAGQVLGVVGRDGSGQSGLEFLFDRDLRGTDGWRYGRLDSRNRVAPSGEDRSDQAVHGLGVKLTLDSKIQSIVELALERGVKRSGANQGVAVIVDPSTGDILAMANYPFFNPNAHDKEAEDWKNQAVAKVYEPGSTFKVITAAALLEEKLMKPSDTVDAEGGTYKISGEVIKDTHPLDRISFTDALAHSSNIAFAKMSVMLKPSDFYRYIRSFGFGMKTGIPLPAEECGWLKPVRNWSGRSQPTLAFGHEIAVTPLQVIMAMSAVANGGVLMRPRLVHTWMDAAGNMAREEPVREVRRVISEATAMDLRKMMQAVVDSGTAVDIKHPTITIGGKTGTAEKIDPVTGKYLKGRFNSSFVGMAPVDKPAFVGLVLLDEPELHKYGGQSAAPIFREILDRLAVDWKWIPQRQGVWASQRNTENSNPIQSAIAPSLIPLGSLLPEKAQNWETTDPVMPDVRESTLRDALHRLHQLGIEVEYSGQGRVQSQIPAAGTPLRPGLRCRITLGWMG